MKESKNGQVPQFLEEVMMIDDEKFQLLQKLRKIVFEQCPNVNERMMYGGIMFSIRDDFGGVFVRKNHVSFEFADGYRFTDPDNLLEGTGKFRRHLKIRSLADIRDKKTNFFVKQAG